MELEALEMLLGTDVFLIANPEIEDSTSGSGSGYKGSGGSGGGSYDPGMGGGAKF
jgi:hypothetical protein